MATTTEAGVGEATATGSDSGEASTPRRRGFWPSVRGREFSGLLYASIWLGFLALPITATAYSDAALGWKLLSWTATAGFGLTYAWLMAWWLSKSRTDTVPLRQAGSCAVLAAWAVLTIPAAGTWVVTFMPFMAALIIFTSKILPGIPVGFTVWAVPTLAAFIIDGAQIIWIVVGPGFGMVFIIITRLTEHVDERSQAAEVRMQQAEERDRIARDVHDVIGHSLTVLSIKAQLANRLMETDPDRARAELDEIEALSRQSLGEVRSTVTRLKAPQLPGEITVACSSLESAGIIPVIESTIDDDGGPAVLAWALREAVTNVVRHSQARRCEIVIDPERIRIADDGLGLDGMSEGNGLRGLRERAKSAGAVVVAGRAYPELEGTSPEQPGTQIEVSLR